MSADDVLQEAYTDAFLNITDFEPRGVDSFAAWLTTIARHNLRHATEALEAEKRGGARRQIERGSDDESYLYLYELLDGTTTTPSRAAALAEAREALDLAIAQLPTDYRRVVRMYDLEGRSTEKVSSEMERSQGAVFMLRARSHRALRRLLGTPLKYFSDCG